MFVAADVPWAGLAAIVAAVGGLITAIMGMRKARAEGAEDCHAALVACREESERYAKALHRVRLTHPDLIGEISEPPFSSDDVPPL